MEITIKEYEKYDSDEILNLYNSVCWCSYTNRPKMLEHAFEHSLKILGAHDGNKLVGLVRAVGDGYSVLFIQDILVLPEYQRKGIGTMLLKSMLGFIRKFIRPSLLQTKPKKLLNFINPAVFFHIPKPDVKVL